MNDDKELEDKPIMRLAFPEETDNNISPPKDEEILFKISNIKLDEGENPQNKIEIKETKINQEPEEIIEKESDKKVLEEKKPNEEELVLEENKMIIKK